MVGEPGGPGRRAAELNAALPETGPARVRADYDASAGAWSAGPERAYQRFAEALIAVAAGAGLPLGPVVLDLGAGTGVAGRAALAAGAERVISADAALGMLRFCGPDLNPVAADAAALPLRDGCADLVVAAFVLSHLPDLAAGLKEIRRVGRSFAAASFAAGFTHPAKDAVDEVLRAFGYQPPGWHDWLKNDAEPVVADQARMAGLAAHAGFAGVRLTTTTVDTGLASAAELAGWRLGMANIAPFVAGLEPDWSSELKSAAERAVAATGCPPLAAPLLTLTGY
jgi:ubiquinone/menaquinone biosynthesis C-methylase UbiE